MLKTQGRCRMRFYSPEGVKKKKKKPKKNPQNLCIKLYQRGLSQRSWIQPTDLQQNLPSTGCGVLELQNSCSLMNIQQWKLYTVMMSSSVLHALFWFIFFLKLLTQTINIKNKTKQTPPRPPCVPPALLLLRFFSS